ncbi:MAG: alpha-amylase [Deltaproteobacteria bacterium]|nr:alpha-amylase [Deltaproteobacteria bacterium]
MNRPRRSRPLAAVLTATSLWLLGGCGDSGAQPDAGTVPTDGGGNLDGSSASDGSTAADGSTHPDGSTVDAGPSRPVTVDVSSIFPSGTAVRDAYTGRTAVVAADGRVSLDADPHGVVLIERDRSSTAAFSWDNATVYFVMTDRFFNGDPSNDHSYGRQRDNAQEIGTWHGGDLRGLTEKLDYLDALGVNALWITAPVEQVHGWVGGGAGDFQHFAYHGYWAMDFTKLDQNLGTPADLRALIDAAHTRGIRVIFDVVMNHPGYATGQDLLEYLPEVIQASFQGWMPAPGGTWHDWNTLVDYNSQDWARWWGPRWIRAGFPGHNTPGQDDYKMSLAYLPDFITEDFRPVTGLPELLTRKTDTAAVPIQDATVRQYLVAWQSAWVREYGVDGFRADTAKHVEPASWSALKAASVTALREWKAQNPGKKLDDLDFWMTGEVFPHGVVRDAYFDNGFDSLINFDFQTSAKQVIRDHARLEQLYAMYAASINSDPTFNVLSYISSHDTNLFFADTSGDLDAQFRVGTSMLLLPGGVQIFYGDETARPLGPAGSDAKQGTRSDMNWSGYEPSLLAHWQKLGQFRRNHLAVGGGSHRSLTFDGGYAFARTYDRGTVKDDVVVLLLD